MEEKIKIMSIIGTLIGILITVSFVLFRTFAISTESVMIYPMVFFNDFISTSASAGSSEAMISSILSPLTFIAPFIPLALGFSVLIFYGIKYGEDRKFGLVVTLVPSLIGIVLLGPSLTSVLFALALAVSGVLCTPIAVMYLKELKKFRRYRIGSRTMGKLFFFINLVLFFALLINVTYGADNYNQIYSEEMKGFIMEMLPDVDTGDMPEIEGFDLLPPEQQQEIMEQYSELTESQKEMVESRMESMVESENISAMISLLVFITPMMVFAVLEMLRIVLLSPLAGFASSVSLPELKN